MSVVTLATPRRSDHVWGLALAIGWTSILAATSHDVGIPRDESFYFQAADRAAWWFESLGRADVASFEPDAIRRGFQYNREHPVLMKSLFGLSHRFLHEKWGLVDDPILAYRLPTMVMAGLSLWLAWLLGIIAANRMVAFVAVLALCAMPRLFFHSHLACFDGPVTFMWLFGVYTYVRAMRAVKWAPMVGVAIGFGFATKLNIFFLPFTLLLVACLDVLGYRRRTGRWWGPKDARSPLFYAGAIALSIIVIGGFVFWVHWPWLYFDTIPHLREYVAFHARHEHYPVDFLGTLLIKPPFPVTYPWVMLVLTVPVATLVLGAVGLAQIGKRAWLDWRTDDGADRRQLELTLLLNFLVPICIIALPNTPIFGGTKHWMPAMPFLAIGVGFGAQVVTRGLWPSLSGRLHGAIAGVMLLPAVWATAEYGTQGPVYYNALAGGPPGAASLGMPRNFWGYSTNAILPAVNAETEQRAYVFWHKATRGAIDAYKAAGQLRQDVRYTGDWTAAYSDWAVYHDQHEKMPEELDVWRAYGTPWPVDGHFVDGIQMVALYRRRPAPPKKNAKSITGGD
ncbi:MAG: glycosyltransferase family 39 protein [Myxococcota bacterium]|nr:glycosyltransferase family 39 protein [Myxococcota bacterium]